MKDEPPHTPWAPLIPTHRPRCAMAIFLFAQYPPQWPQCGFRLVRGFTVMRREIFDRPRSGLPIIDIRHALNLGRVAVTRWIAEGETRRPGRPFLGCQYSSAGHPGGLGEDRQGYH
jgi:hypothetical protein